MGAITFRCLHDSCADKDWYALRDLLISKNKAYGNAAWAAETVLEAADRIEALETALHLIAGTHGTEAANPRWVAANALAAPKAPDS